MYFNSPVKVNQMPTTSIKGRQMPPSPIRKLVPFAEKAKKEGKTSTNPLKESFGNKYNFKYVLLALFLNTKYVLLLLF